MRHRLLAVLVVALIAAAGCTDRLEGKFGEELFQAGCAHCHGADLSGEADLAREAPALGAGSNADLELTDEQIADVIRVGPGAMPSFRRRLTDEQIDSLVLYLRLVQRGPSPD
jgi:mono/diheme cytochrome c family protein